MTEAEGRKQVELRVFATLRRLRPPHSVLDLQGSADIAALLEVAGIPAEKAAIIFLNGRHAELSAVPAGGDSVAVFPPVGGG